jgi:N utilization substance protein B
MLNRRHIRIKVMQSIYALLHSKSDDLIKEEKFLKHSIDKIYDLYILTLSLLVEIRDLADQHLEIGKKKFLATSEDINPNQKFVKNRLLLILKESAFLNNYLKDHKLKNWKNDGEYVRLIWDEIKASDLYKSYVSSDVLTFNDDREFLTAIFKNIVAPNDKLFDYFESQNISWVDDIPFVNTLVLKMFSRLNQSKGFVGGSLYNDDDDKKFVGDLFKKVALNHTEFDNDIDNKTPNWDADRIADIDLILIKMALVELVYFPSIPVRVTINEYIEIAKDYSTSKSGFFINGVLDKLSKEYTKSGKSKKIGRGLL